MARESSLDSKLVGLRERKKSQTRAALHRAALRLFNDRGFGATSVDQIAAAANVSRSTFFRYFGSKEAVLFADSDQRGQLLIGFLAARPAREGPFTAFSEALLELTEAIDADAQRDTSRMFEAVTQDEPALRARRFAELERWTEVVASAFARRRTGRAGADPAPEDRLAAATCLAIVQQIGNEWLREGETTAADVIMEAFATVKRLAV